LGYFSEKRAQGRLPLGRLGGRAGAGAAALTRWLRRLGLVTVGVHTPEFASEWILGNVQAAVERQEIGWPVVQDNDMSIWRAYGNRYWPCF
jgi:hypothetical protein